MQANYPRQADKMDCASTHSNGSVPPRIVARDRTILFIPAQMDSAMALAPAMAAPMPNTLMPSQTRGDWRISEREVGRKKKERRRGH